MPGITKKVEEEEERVIKFGKQIDNNEGPNFEKKKPSNLNKVRSKLMFDI